MSTDADSRNVPRPSCSAICTSSIGRIQHRVLLRHNRVGSLEGGLHEPLLATLARDQRPPVNRCSAVNQCTASAYMMKARSLLPFGAQVELEGVDVSSGSRTPCASSLPRARSSAPIMPPMAKSSSGPRREGIALRLGILPLCLPPRHSRGGQHPDPQQRRQNHRLHWAARPTRRRPPPGDAHHRRYPAHRGRSCHLPAQTPCLLPDLRQGQPSHTARAVRRPILARGPQRPLRGAHPRHAREERRSIKVTAAGGLAFPVRARWCASSVTVAGTAPSPAAARPSLSSPTWTITRPHLRLWPLMPKMKQP